MIFFALINLIPITLTLPGIAGLVLTIGVAADSNIVIFERIKEEVRAGRSMSSAISAGYKRGISTIIDANVVTLLTAFILFVLATSGVKGFAFTLGVGTIVSLLTAVVFTQALLGSMSRSRLLRSPSALGAGGEGRRWHFDFMGASRWFFSISGVILLVGGLALATKQLNFGIDFESGTRIKVALDKPTDEEGVRDTPRRGRDQRRGDPAGLRPGTRRQRLPDPVRTSSSRTRSKRREAALAAEFGVAEDGFDSTSVGPTFGQQVADSALKALIFSLLVICGYVALRFDPKFAVPVLIAIFHDILITAGVYSLTGKEVSSGTVAAFLTILGYSIYDTIIVFDRIRENVPRMPRAAFSQIVNRSMSEVLTRSLATSFSTLLGGRLAAGLRRRDPAGLRLRDAGRDRLRYLLVDLHRLAGADRLEGTRAGLRPPPPADRRGRGQRAGLRRRRRDGRSSAATTRPKRRSPRRAAEEPAAEPPAGRGRHRRAAPTSGNGADLAAATATPTPRRRPRPSAASATPSARARRQAAPQAREEALAMALLVWFTMGIALWHFTVFLPDHFWQGIVGAFVGAVLGSIIFGADRPGGQRQRPRRHRSRRPR